MKIHGHFLQKPNSKRRMSLEPFLSNVDIFCQNTYSKSDLNLDLNRRTFKDIKDLPKDDPYHQVYEGVIFMGESPYNISDSETKLLRYKVPAGYRDMGNLTDSDDDPTMYRVPTPEYVIDVLFRIETTDSSSQPYRLYVNTVLLTHENREILEVAPFTNTWGVGDNQRAPDAISVCSGSALYNIFGETAVDAINNLIQRLPDLMTSHNNLDLRVGRSTYDSPRDLVQDLVDYVGDDGDSDDTYNEYVAYWAFLKAIDELTDETPETMFSFAKLQQYTDNPEIVNRMEEIVSETDDYPY